MRGLHVGLGEEEVDGLRLVDPLLTSGSGIDDGVEADSEDGLVFLLDGVGDIFDIGEFAVEILELVEHVLAPETLFLEVADELAIENDEVAGEVGLHIEVLVVRLDTRGGAHDVGDGRGRGDSEHVRVTHTVLGDLLAQVGPVHLGAARHVDL